MIWLAFVADAIAIAAVAFWTWRISRRIALLSSAVAGLAAMQHGQNDD